MTETGTTANGGSVVALVKVTWSAGFAELELRVIDEDNTQLRSVPAVGYHLHYRADPASARVCLGHVDMATAAPFHCDRTPEAGQKRCERCRAKDVAFSVNLHQAHTRGTSELDPGMVEHLRQPNVLYIAGFGDGSAKVGTSTEHRWMTRLAEQGAWRAQLIARTDNGIAVRRAEDLITADLGLPQAVSASRKISGTTRPISAEKLTETIAQLAKRAQEILLGELGADTETLDTDWTNPTTAGLQAGTTNAIDYPATITKGSHDFHIESMIGRIALAHRSDGNDLFAIDLGELYGLALTLGDWDPEPIAVQGSLFG